MGAGYMAGKGEWNVKELLKRVELFIKEHSLIDEGEKVVVAVSGGVDSVLLLNVMNILGRSMSFSIHAAHLDHGLRSSSERDARFVKKICEKLEIPCTVERRKVEKRKGESLEEAARRVRYEYLREVKRKVGASKIATAHHLSDLAETILYRLIRGSGPVSLSGISPKNGDLIRPFLFLRRDEIERYAKSLSLHYVTDETNFDLTIPRNFIRHRIIPLMKILNPSLEESLYRFSKISWMMKGFIERNVGKIMERSRTFSDGIEIPIPNDEYLKSEIIRKAFEKTYGKLPEWEKVERVIKRKDESFKEEFYSGWGVWRSGSRMFVGKLFFEKAEFDLEEGDYRIWDFNITVSRDKIAGSDGLRSVKGMKLRNRRAGDRIGRKKLKDLLIDSKVPPYFRDRIPVVAVGNRVVWVANIWKDREFNGNDLFIRINRNPFEGRF